MLSAPAKDANQERRQPTFCVALLALSVLLALVQPASARAAEGEACSNTAVRMGFSALLPDCRAYERVSAVESPPELEAEVYYAAKDRGTHGGFNIDTDPAYRAAFASVSGDAFAYMSTEAPAGALSGGEHLRAERTAGGWVVEDLSPPQSPDYGIVCPNGYPDIFNPELSEYVLSDGWGQGDRAEGRRCGTDDPPLVSGEPPDTQNLFLTGGEGGPYQLIDSVAGTPAGSEATNAWFEDASEDLSHVLFDEDTPLTTEAPPGNDLYDWSAGSGSVQLVTRLPNGSPVQGLLAGSQELHGPEGEPSSGHGSQVYIGAMSADGSRVFFVAGGDLYVRLNPERPQSAIGEAGDCLEPHAACTLQLDAAKGGPEAGAGDFAWATPDGQKAFFLDERRLTEDATAAAGNPDLYEYDLEGPGGGRLRDLTAATGERADVLGVSGISSDGDDVYFLAAGSLTTAPSATGATPAAGEPNLYLWHEGTITFIATLAQEDSEDWGAGAARVTPSGEYLAFNSQRELTGYHNIDQGTGEHDDEIFLYRAASNALVCVSCNTTDAPPLASAQLNSPMFETAQVIAKAPGWDFLQRDLADDGRVFFSTAEPLVAGAEDGQENVYEYENGAVHLLSSGKSRLPSFFLEATPDGSDVFIISAQELPGSSEGEYAIYDAREGGGFPPPPEQRCSEEACRDAPASALLPEPPVTTRPAPSGNVLSLKESSTPTTSTRASGTRSGLAKALGACRRMKDASKRRACEARARGQYREQLLRAALAACRRKPHGRTRTKCETNARREYAPAAAGGARR